MNGNDYNCRLLTTIRKKLEIYSVNVLFLVTSFSIKL